ncbi:hypothetical protein M2403_002009 [Rahnella sp. BIGb0603]|nr:hypothetical protein [Rahnella sp. BIGb0603]
MNPKSYPLSLSNEPRAERVRLMMKKLIKEGHSRKTAFRKAKGLVR